ncbi:MAG: hypothetical protein ACKOBG_01375 [Actinomycetota bacterium]
MTGVMDHDPDDGFTDDLADDEVDGIGAGPPAVRAIDRFQHTAIGGVLAAGMLGLRDVFEPERDDQPAIVQDWSGAPPFGDRILLRLDPDNPQDSIVVIRRLDD